MSEAKKNSAKFARMTGPKPSLGDNRQHFRGTLADFSTIELCQILIQGGKTGQLLLFLPNEEELQAYIYFTKGQFVHAKYRFAPDHIEEGIQVLSDIIQIKEGTFDFIFDKPSTATTIQGETMALLMDACRKADESHRKN